MTGTTTGCRSRGRTGARASRFALAFVLCLAACAPPAPADGAPDVALELALAPQPPAEGPASATFTLRDAAGAPIAGAALRLEANMNHAGMVPELAEARDAGDGRYVAEFEFTMGGDWYLLAELRLPDGREVERRFDVRGVAAR